MTTHRHRSPRRSALLPALLISLASGLLTNLAAEEKSTEAQPVLSVTLDRANATYAIGEPVRFLFTLSQNGQPAPQGEISWSITQDGVAPATQGVVALKDGKAEVTGTLDRPGFLQCKAVLKAEKNNIRGLGGAAVAPLSITPSLPVPDDFDAFWKTQVAKLPPLNAKLTPLPGGPVGIDFFDVQADAVGDRPMSGYYARPADAKPKSCPAVITLEGAGVYNTRKEPWLFRLAKDGFLSLEINAHGLPNGKPDSFYLDLEKGALKDYQFAGRESRETFYFLPMYLRAIQGVNFLAAQPEWDGRILIANGTSQGAAQSIFVAAMDPRVTMLTALVPAMCDHSGMAASRIVGWPRLVPNGPDGKPDPAALETSRYFDSVNFASRVRAPAIFIAGFIDQVTPPTSVYAAYNQVRSQKEIQDAITSPHRFEPGLLEEVHARMLRHAKDGK